MTSMRTVSLSLQIRTVRRLRPTYFTGYGPKSRHARMQPPTLSPKASDAAASAMHARYTQLCAAEAAEA